MTNQPQEAIAMLRRQFGEKAKERMRELLVALKEVSRQPDGGEPLDAATQLAHTLHGTMGSYGFSAPAKVAREVETALRRMAKEGAANGQNLAALEEQLRRTIRVFDPSPFLDERRPQRMAATILAVDDDEDFTSYLADVGGQHLCRVIQARNPVEAIRAARKTGLHGAIINTRLGEGESGIELAEELRKMPGQMRLHVAFVSGDDRLDLRTSCVKAGGTLFLKKPVIDEELRTAFTLFAAARTRDQSRLLLVDDDADLAALLKAEIETMGVFVEVLTEPQDLLEALDRFHPDLLILDVLLPKTSGTELCGVLRAVPRWKRLPVIFLTGNDSAESRRSCFEAGGDDFVTKPVVEEELFARVRVWLDRAYLERELVMRDPVTGLLTRQAFLDGVTRQLSLVRREGGTLGLAILDLDRLKEINDQHGHQQGDAVLRELGRLLLVRFRSHDLRARWGGDELVVSVRDAPAETMRELLAKLLDEFRRIDFSSESTFSFNASFSAGVAAYPDDGQDLPSILHAADSRLYKAKEQGRDRVVL